MPSFETPIVLRSGEATHDPRLDRVQQVDLRSLDYGIREMLTTDQYRNPRTYTWRLTERLDQQAEGACCGFAFAHELAARPGVVTGIGDAYARGIYHDAQRVDEWEGGSYPGADPVYEGTSILAGAKVVKARGLIKEYRWALSLRDLVTAIGYFGPAVMGCYWYEGMIDTDSAGFIRPTGRIVGGHAICMVGVNITRSADGSADPVRSYFILHNSWGTTWGVHGRCMLALIDAAKLWPSGDFCIPVGRMSAAAG